MEKLYIIVIAILISGAVSGQKRMTRAQYISTYKDLAIKEQKRSGIPASVTLAQGILESGDGNSELAREGNNHFGIKCHSGWNGKEMFLDDDAKDECFRVYPTVYQSYKDHSDFLMTRSRYADLFKLKSTDYKGWARGLKKAGYATNPKYADLLIRIIDENKLYEYDKATGKKDKEESTKKEKKNFKQQLKKERKSTNSKRSEKLEDIDNFIISPFGRKIYSNNSVHFIVVEENDTYNKITKDLDLLDWELYKYNDLDKGSKIHKGQKLYIKPKKGKAAFGKNYHIVEKGETMHSISQEYAIKLKKLYRLNNLPVGTEVKQGTKLWLRKRKPPTE
jgi:LysM repeat protein